MKRYLLLLFVLLFPYYVVFAVECILKDRLMETVFHNDVFVLFLTLLVVFVAALLTSVAVFIISIVKKWNAKDLLRANMIMKLVHIPAYIAILYFTFAFMLTIFTFAISMIMIIMACITIFMSGLIGLAGVIRSAIEKKLSAKEAIIHGILQFIFCADIISSIVIYKKVKKSA